MAMDVRRSGYALLEYEIAQERASALGRQGRRLEAALAALAAHLPTAPQATAADRKIHDDLVAQAGYALWLLIVQREACGVTGTAHVLQDYRVPDEVFARMGPLPPPPGESSGLPVLGVASDFTP